MAGGSFGEMALTSGMVRAATVICVGTSEFLRIDKHDFQQVFIDVTRSYAALFLRHWIEYAENVTLKFLKCNNIVVGARLNERNTWSYFKAHNLQYSCNG